MGQISYSAMRNKAQDQGNQEQSNKPRVSYFGLKNDRDEAIVRFMQDTPDDFDTVVCHAIQDNGRYKKYNCLRERTDPLDKCPLCAAGVQLAFKCYFYLLEYTKDENGQIIATPKVWERSLKYADTIANLADEYGPLSDTIFKIKRNGAAGDLSTTYTVLPANPAIYTQEVYPKHPEFFENYKALGNCVCDYSYDALYKMLNEDNEEPAVKSEDIQTFEKQTSQESAPWSNIQRQVVQEPIKADTSTANSSATPANDNFARPRRFY